MRKAIYISPTQSMGPTFSQKWHVTTRVISDKIYVGVAKAFIYIPDKTIVVKKPNWYERLIGRDFTVKVRIAKDKLQKWCNEENSKDSLVERVYSTVQSGKIGKEGDKYAVKRSVGKGAHCKKGVESC